MKFVELEPSEFMNFVNTRKEKNFFQTTMMQNKLNNDGLKTYLVGVKENDKVIAASLIAESKKHFGKIIYEAYKGFILDYSNKDLLKFMTINVKEFLKGKNGMELIIDPYVQNISSDIDGNLTN